MTEKTTKPSKKSKSEGGTDAKVTVVPQYLDPKTGQILLEKVTAVDEESGKERTRTRPIRLKPKQFPRTREGRVAYCKYQVALWTWKGANVSVTGSDPLAKKERSLARLLKKIEAVKAEIASEKAGAK